jgi:hypothetical protein
MSQVDLKEIKEYIESKLENFEVAINTITKITKSIHRLSEFPDSGALLFFIIMSMIISKSCVCFMVDAIT